VNRARAQSMAAGWGSRIGEPGVLLSAVALALIGLVMVYSSSSVLAEKRYLDGAYFFKRQFLHLAVGLVVMLVLAGIDYSRLKRVAYLGWFLAVAGLVLVLIPGLGHTAGGATRWLRIGSFSLQPSEFAKLALVFFMARYLSDNQHYLKSFSRGLMPILGPAGVMALLILPQPDLGMTITIMTLALVMLFVAGTRLSYLLGFMFLGGGAFYILVFHVKEYWEKRVTSYLDPWSDPLGTGYHIIHSFLAFGSGGLLGNGLGGSKQKLFYLPEPHTDFILSVLGEEFGLVGVFVVLGLFMWLIYRGIHSALAARDLFGTYLALGCTLIIGIQAFVNAGSGDGHAAHQGADHAVHQLRRVFLDR
jgi:cell division protein FtsW